MGIKISNMTLTGSIPTDALMPVVYDGANYAVSGANVGSPVAYANLWQTGTQGVVRSKNIASITDIGVGSTRLAFTNYVTDPVIQATTSSIAGGIGEISLGTAITTGGVNILPDYSLAGDIASIGFGVNRNGAGGYDAGQVMITVW